MNFRLRAGPKALCQMTACSAHSRFRQNYLMRNPQKRYRSLPAKEIFTKIYEEGARGRPDDSDQKYFSGTGSHDDAIANAYVEAVAKFRASFAEKPSVVDLGCGDFTVGARIRRLCGTYIACDIVEPLIGWDKQKYKGLNVDFRLLDICEDELPGADRAQAAHRRDAHHSNRPGTALVRLITRKFGRYYSTTYVLQDTSVWVADFCAYQTVIV